MAEREDPLRLVGAVSLIVLFLFLVQAAVEGCRPSGRWSGQDRDGPTTFPPGDPDPPTEPRPPSTRGEAVYFNRQSLKYHCLTCEWARKCTRNCREMSRAEAIDRGGVPCKVCHSSCS